MTTCRSRLAGASDASLAGQGRVRHVSAASFGALGLVIAIRSSVGASQPCEDDSRGPLCSSERAALAASALLSWCAAAASTPRLTLRRTAQLALPAHLTHFVLRVASVWQLVPRRCGGIRGRTS